MNKVPEPPTTLEKIDEIVAIKLQGWFDYLKKLSPRIAILTPTDKDFDLTRYELLAKELCEYSSDPEDIILENWPSIEKIAFVLFLDSTLPAPRQSTECRARDCYIFCYENRAFNLGYFEQEGIKTEDKMSYSLLNWTDDCLTWEHITKTIKYYIEIIQQTISPPPE
ncbi:MAG: hypothetical protein WCL18_10185 [bacterium]